MKTVRIGLIGAGNIAHTHLVSYAKIEGVEVAAICDINPERLEETANEFGIEKRFNSVTEMLENVELDAADVCVWNCNHAKCTIEALEAGLHVMCEKPMAYNTEEAVRMKEAAEKAGKLLKALKNAAEYKSDTGAILCGINLEGPFLSVEKKGGNDEDYFSKIDMDLYNEYVKASGNLIKIVCVAPDLEGSGEFIKEVSKEKVVSLAHTPAGYEMSMQAFSLGASHVTHMFNGMSAFSHRETGVVGAAMDSGATVELIGDGRHVSDPMIRAAFKMFGDEKIVLISDSLSAAGLPDGEYMMGKLKITVEHGLARLADGTIAGASTNLFDNLKHVIECGINPESAIRTATYNPAKVLGVDSVSGTLEVGKLANFVIIDDAFNIKAVYIKGKKVGTR